MTAIRWVNLGHNTYHQTNKTTSIYLGLVVAWPLPMCFVLILVNGCGHGSCAFMAIAIDSWTLTAVKVVFFCPARPPENRIYGYMIDNMDVCQNYAYIYMCMLKPIILSDETNTVAILKLCLFWGWSTCSFQAWHAKWSTDFMFFTGWAWANCLVNRLASCPCVLSICIIPS